MLEKLYSTTAYIQIYHHWLKYITVLVDTQASILVLNTDTQW